MADGAGITIGTDSYATFKFDSNNTKWATNISLDVSGALAVSGALSGATSIDGTGDLTMGTITMTGFSVDADGDTVTKSINNTSGGITNTGAIAGATTIDGTGDLTMGTITMTGFSVDADGDTVTKSINNTSGGITNTGAIAGATTINASGAITGGSFTDGTATLDTGALSGVTTFSSSGATSLATGGGVVNIASTGVMTTVKGTLNVDEAVTLDSTLRVIGTGRFDAAVTLTSTLDVTGDTSVSTFDSTGATSLATSSGDVTIATSGNATTVKGTLDVEEAVTLDDSLRVTGTSRFDAAVDINSTVDIGNTLTLSKTNGDGLTVTNDILLGGKLNTSSNSAQIPATFSTFKLVTANLNTDLSALGGVDYTDYQDATDWSATRRVSSGHSYIRMEFKVNFISSPEFDQTLSFRVLRSLNGGLYSTVFEDTEIGSNMGVTIRGVYNGTYIDDLAGGLNSGQDVIYKLQVKRNKASGDTIVTPFGIVPGGNYIFLQELYQPNA